MTVNKPKKVLNLYAGIGGNRKLWENVEVTAIEQDQDIAGLYSLFFPQDKVIVADAHKYLLENYKNFDFIWTSPPCTTHSTLALLCGSDNSIISGNHKKKAQYPDMNLYQEIIFLQHYFKGKYVVENVKGYYKPLIKPQIAGRHYFWSNFIIGKPYIEPDNIKYGNIKEWETQKGFIIPSYVNVEKRKVLRNCVNPKLGLHILNMAFKEQQTLLK